MYCKLCDWSRDAAVPTCNYHPGELFHLYVGDSRIDYRDVYRWSCCGESSLSSISESGSDISPSRSPGCRNARAHVYDPTIYVCHSDSAADLANECVASLTGGGYNARAIGLSSVRAKDLRAAACAVLVADSCDSMLVDQLTRTLPNPYKDPWVVVSWVGVSEASRLHTANPTTLAAAASGAVRRHFALPVERPVAFKQFISYRRTESGLARTLHRFLGGWWDELVLAPGVDWSTEIELAIRDCDLFTVIAKDDLPQKSYVWRELQIAVKHNRPIAVLSLGPGGAALSAALGMSFGSLTPGRLLMHDRHGQPRPARDVLYSTPPATPFVLFSDLEIDESNGLDTPRNVTLFSLLRDFPAGWKAIEPVARGHPSFKAKWFRRKS